MSSSSNCFDGDDDTKFNCYSYWGDLDDENEKKNKMTLTPSTLDFDGLKKQALSKRGFVASGEPRFCSSLVHINFKQQQQQRQKLQLQQKNTEKERQQQQKNDADAQSGPTPKFQPSIDSYIVNTIKLNHILKNGIPFDQVDFFARNATANISSSDTSRTSNTNKNENNKKQRKCHVVKTDLDARKCLKNFITIMSIHSGFDEASSIALDVLVDILDHFIESFCKLLKNLKNIRQVDMIANNESRTTSIQPDFYSSQLFLEQAFLETGIGTIKDIKDFYVNDVINYYNKTYKKVSKLYTEYKTNQIVKSKLTRAAAEINSANSDDKLDEFMKENDFLNDESSTLLSELMSDVPHFDEEINKLLQIMGPDPFSFINNDYANANNNNNNSGSCETNNDSNNHQHHHHNHQHAIPNCEKK